MFEPYRKMLDLLEAREKRIFILLIGFMILAAFSEVIGLSAFMVLLSVLAEPEKIADNDTLNWLYTTFDFNNIFMFQLSLSLLVALVIIMGLLIKAGSHYFVIRFTTLCGHSLSSRMLEAYLKQPYSWSLDRNSADIGRKILAECEQLVQRVTRPSLGILASCLLALSIVLFLITVDPVIAFVSFALLAGGYGMSYLFVRQKLLQNGAEIVASNKERFSVTQEVTTGLKEVKLAGLENTYVEEFRRPSLRRAQSSVKAQILTDLPRFVLEGLTFSILLIMVLILLVRADGNLLAAIPTLGIFAFSVMRILPALQQVYHGLASLKSGSAVIDIIHSDYIAVNAGTREHTKIDRTTRHDLTDALVFDSVTYTYPSAQKKALTDLSIEIKANSIIGIVGGTGAGKTTFVDLLLGLLSPDEGGITVNGVSISGDQKRPWQNTIGYVPQQIFLTDNTVTANIAFGVPSDEVDFEAVQRAAKTAALHDFIMAELPDGYDSSIGDRGVRLSGGQRQRIGIARALYHDPSLLILDEATSALDNITERQVMKAVQKLQGEKTVIMIAHRLSTVEKCDSIILMQGGEIMAVGTYHELLETNEVFREMVGDVSENRASA